MKRRVARLRGSVRGFRVWRDEFPLEHVLLGQVALTH